MGYRFNIMLIRFVIILVYNFLVCSIRVIGRVWLSSPVNIGFLDIGNMLLCFHALGIVWDLRHLLSRSNSILWKVLPACLIISLEISVGSGALLQGESLITEESSWTVIRSSIFLYH